MKQQVRFSYGGGFKVGCLIIILNHFQKSYVRVGGGGRGRGAGRGAATFKGTICDVIPRTRCLRDLHDLSCLVILFSGARQQRVNRQNNSARNNR